MNRNRNYDKKDGNKGRNHKPNARGNKPSTRRPRKQEETGDDSKEMEKDSSIKYNKLYYYIQDKILVDNASQLSYQSINGLTPLDNYQVPTIMRIRMNPSPGLTYQGANTGLNHPRRTGINMAGLKLFNMLSMKSGRNMAYAPQDVSTAILAMSQLLAMHSYVHRLFASVNVWNTYNRMYPRAVIQAMGIDYEDFVSNYSDYRTRYNALCASANQLPIIVNMGYLEKSMTQYSYIFADDDSPLSQTFIYVPETTWVLDETSYQGGSILKTTQVVPATGVRTFADFMINVMRPMVDALLESSTLNLVYADLLNLASYSGEIKFTQLNYVVDGEAILPIKNDEALIHIHNMVAIREPDLASLYTSGSAIYTPYNDVYPDAANNCLAYNPCRKKGNITSDMVATSVLLDSPVSNPDPELRIEISRYVSMYTNNGVTISNVPYLSYTISSDYYVTYFQIIQFDELNPTTYTSMFSTAGTPDVSKMSQFDWHPILRDYDPSTGLINKVYGDLNYWTVTDIRYLERLNELIYLGLFTLNDKTE